MRGAERRTQTPRLPAEGRSSPDCGRKGTPSPFLLWFHLPSHGLSPRSPRGYSVCSPGPSRSTDSAPHLWFGSITIRRVLPAHRQPSSREDGRCAEQKVVAEKTEVPAEFKISCECRASRPRWAPTCWLTGRAGGLRSGLRVPRRASSHRPSFHLQGCGPGAWGRSLLGCSDPGGHETKLTVYGRGLGEHLGPPPPALPSQAPCRE